MPFCTTPTPGGDVVDFRIKTPSERAWRCHNSGSIGSAWTGSLIWYYDGHPDGLYMLNIFARRGR